MKVFGRVMRRVWLAGSIFWVGYLFQQSDLACLMRRFGLGAEVEFGRNAECDYRNAEGLLDTGPLLIKMVAVPIFAAMIIVAVQTVIGAFRRA